MATIRQVSRPLQVSRLPHLRSRAPSGRAPGADRATMGQRSIHGGTVIPGAGTVQASLHRRRAHAARGRTAGGQDAPQDHRRGRRARSDQHSARPHEPYTSRQSSLEPGALLILSGLLSHNGAMRKLCLAMRSAMRAAERAADVRALGTALRYNSSLTELELASALSRHLSQRTCGRSRRTCCVFNVRGALHVVTVTACTLVRRWAMQMTKVRNFKWLTRSSS